MIWYTILITGSNKRPHYCSIPIHCIRMEESGSTHASTHSFSAAAGVYAHYYWKLIKEGKKREKKRAGRSWEVEKKTKQGHQHLMTTSACPTQLRSLRAKIPFREAGRRRETENERGGPRAPGWWQAPPCISFLPIIITTGNRPLWCLFTYGVSSLGLLLLFTFLKSLKKCNTYNIGSRLI